MLFCNKCHNFYEETYIKIDDNGLCCRQLNKISDKPECGDCKNNLIKIDVEIAPLLTALWDKGYETLFSCSGHSNAAYTQRKYYDLNAYILIDASKLTDEFINKIIHIANNNYNSSVNTRVMYSTYNNYIRKCISIHRNNSSPNINEFERTIDGYNAIPPSNTIASTHAYSLLCQVRKDMTNLIERLPVVSDSDLKKSDNDEIGNDYSLAYNKLWVDRQLEKYPKARRDVLTFISATNQYSEGTSVDNGFRSPIEKLFSSGFCYYFAIMLRDAFGGKIVQKFHDDLYPHIFWMDENEVLYDIYGVYDDCNAKECVPIEEMDEESLAEFRHIPNMD